MAVRMEHLLALVLLAAFLTSTSCSRTRTMTPDAANLVAPAGEASEWKRIVGYESAGGQHRALKARIRSVGDSLQLEVLEKQRIHFTRLERDDGITATTVTVPRDSVAAIETNELSFPRTVLFALVAGALIGIGAFIAVGLSQAGL